MEAPINRLKTTCLSYYPVHLVRYGKASYSHYKCFYNENVKCGRKRWFSENILFVFCVVDEYWLKKTPARPWPQWAETRWYSRASITTRKKCLKVRPAKPSPLRPLLKWSRSKPLLRGKLTEPAQSAKLLRPERPERLETVEEVSEPVSVSKLAVSLSLIVGSDMSSRNANVCPSGTNLSRAVFLGQWSIRALRERSESNQRLLRK